MGGGKVRGKTGFGREGGISFTHVKIELFTTLP